MKSCKQKAVSDKLDSRLVSPGKRGLELIDYRLSLNAGSVR